MFTDWTEALEAEALPLDPNPQHQLAAAARVTARSSRDKDDLGLLLDVLGLPTDTDTLTALLPLLPETGDAPTMTNTPAAPALSAHEAMAISMHNNGDTEQAIREATGLSETELSDLIANQALGLPRPAADAPAIDVPVVPLAVSNEIQELLDWAAAHPAAGVRSRAARITADLSELTDRRDSEAAQREAEAKVAKARAELEKAQEELRTVKAGTRSTTAAATAPTPIRSGLGSGRTREELAAIRTWARANGHQVADAGMVRKAVLEAYDAAHQAPVRKAG
ncbi:Lsr2 family protein [Streptomyces sp. ME02-6987-2C]|uniref:Lsr2 family DNA-binding protein n=1 Tax=unclassified Streptomyces TaxID=2593676 RepID=UPI0029B4869B|nr:MULTISPECIES: histone-like nucleoid-structuring protein Lsr2 [unclassified Streptomyces]MDX3370458.1 Lsr2 family protein [Streptomyces sp. ME02-6987-2C]MDX3425995.1 Lsr2 family protein [Streptomyces sp. ME02-6985-2c]